jgi:AraC-like DNA-binding protein/ligand-binding sensor protein
MKIGTEKSLKGREIEPLLFKASSILSAYEQASDCVVQVLDSEGRSFDLGKTESERFFCCCGWSPAHCKMGDCGEHCGAVHQSAVGESRRLGSSYIYMCPVGLVFWTSPLYAGGHYMGALIAGKVLGIEKEEAGERMRASGMDGEEIEKNLERIPRKNYEEIKALAQMMLLCTQRISPGGAGPGGAGPGSAGMGPQEAGRAVPGSVLSGKAEGGGTENQSPHSETPESAEAAETTETAEAAETTDVENPMEAMDIPTPPNSNERLLIAALRRGDGPTAKRILENILTILDTICPGDLRFFRCRAIELVVLLSRSCAAEKETRDLLEENNLHLKRINESSTIEELSINLHRIVERMAGRIFSFQGLRHASALRRAERFIWKNYTRKVSLDEIAAASGLSAPYFSTIFREEMGEYLSTHLNRLRVEKACIMLIETNASLNNISESCGFEDQSWFSKIFKSYTGYSPGKYRDRGGINVYSQSSNCAG